MKLKWRWKKVRLSNYEKNVEEILRNISGYPVGEIDNILKGNEKLKLPIIQESDKTEHICSEENRVPENNLSPIIATVVGAAFVGLIFTILGLCI